MNNISRKSIWKCIPIKQTKLKKNLVIFILFNRVFYIFYIAHLKSKRGRKRKNFGPDWKPQNKKVFLKRTENNIYLKNQFYGNRINRNNAVILSATPKGKKIIFDVEHTFFDLKDEM